MDSWILSEANRRHEDLRSFVVRDRLGRSLKDSGRSETCIGSAKVVRKFWDFLARQLVNLSRSGRGGIAILTPKGVQLLRRVSQDRPANRR